MTEASPSTTPRRASFGRRLFAYLFDIVVTYLPIIAVWLALGSPGGDVTNALAALWFIGLAAYFLWLWTRGATLGMKIVGIGVRDEDGRLIGFGQAVSRLIGLTLVQVFLTIPIFLLVFLVYRVLRRHYWHDRTSHTLVVRA
jgi:uncharacterized RDD family membrane protein YckC